MYLVREFKLMSLVVICTNIQVQCTSFLYFCVLYGFFRSFCSEVLINLHPTVKCHTESQYLHVDVRFSKKHELVYFVIFPYCNQSKILSREKSHKYF